MQISYGVTIYYAVPFNLKINGSGVIYLLFLRKLFRFYAISRNNCAFYRKNIYICR